jgi:hypothetical protein
LYELAIPQLPEDAIHGNQHLMLSITRKYSCLLPVAVMEITMVQKLSPLNISTGQEYL